MIQSRKNGSKIHADSKVSGIKRFASRIADFIDEGVSAPSRGLAFA